MKKGFLTLMALIAITINANAALVKVHFLTGLTMEGDLRYRDDTTIVMVPRNWDKTLTVKPTEVSDFVISGMGRFYVDDGKFIPDAKTETKLEKKKANAREQLESSHILASNPNEVIGRALKSTGTTAIGLGIPSLLVGTALIVYGNTGIDEEAKTKAERDKIATKGKCSTAGCVLLPMGAALTIVGIPLYVHGKHIAELNINYTGNGAGLSVEF